MARLRQIKTSEGIRVVFREGPNGRELIDSFHVELFKQLLDATLVQLRIVAEESRELVIDKLYAGRARPPGQRRVDRPKRLRRSDIPTVDRRRFRHTALADSTVQDKAKREQDGRPLIAGGEYTYGIEVRKGQRQGVATYTVRPKPGKHPDSNLTHRILAAMLEFGTRNMPKRPHWAPVNRIVRRILREQGPEVRAFALRSAIRRAS